MMSLAPNIPNQPHRWATEIKAWADGTLVQWRYHFAEIPPGLQMAPDNKWRDCPHPSRGMPNWYEEHTEYRVAPEDIQKLTPGQRNLLNENDVWVHVDEPVHVYTPPVLDQDWSEDEKG